MTAPRHALEDLLRCSARGELGAAPFLRRFADLLHDELDCSSTAVRLLVSTSRGVVLRTFVSRERGGRATIDVPDVSGPGLHDYLESIARGDGLVASHARTDPRVPERLRERLGQRGVQSILDAAIRIDGAVHGAITCEQCRRTRWSPLQVQTLRAVAAQASAHLVHMIRSDLDGVAHAGRLACVSPREC